MQTSATAHYRQGSASVRSSDRDRGGATPHTPKASAQYNLASPMMLSPAPLGSLGGGGGGARGPATPSRTVRGQTPMTSTLEALTSETTSLAGTTTSRDRPLHGNYNTTVNGMHSVSSPNYLSGGGSSGGGRGGAVNEFHEIYTDSEEGSSSSSSNGSPTRRGHRGGRRGDEPQQRTSAARARAAAKEKRREEGKGVSSDDDEVPTYSYASTPSPTMGGGGSSASPRSDSARERRQQQQQQQQRQQNGSTTSSTAGIGIGRAPLWSAGSRPSNGPTSSSSTGGAAAVGGRRPSSSHSNLIIAAATAASASAGGGGGGSGHDGFAATARAVLTTSGSDRPPNAVASPMGGVKSSAPSAGPSPLLAPMTSIGGSGRYGPSAAGQATVSASTIVTSQQDSGSTWVASPMLKGGATSPRGGGGGGGNTGYGSALSSPRTAEGAGGGGCDDYEDDYDDDFYTDEDEDENETATAVGTSHSHAANANANTDADGTEYDDGSPLGAPFSVGGQKRHSGTSAGGLSSHHSASALLGGGDRSTNDYASGGFEREDSFIPPPPPLPAHPAAGGEYDDDIPPPPPPPPLLASVGGTSGSASASTTPAGTVHYHGAALVMMGDVQSGTASVPTSSAEGPHYHGFQHVPVSGGGGGSQSNQHSHSLRVVRIADGGGGVGAGNAPVGSSVNNRLLSSVGAHSSSGVAAAAPPKLKPPPIPTIEVNRLKKIARGAFGDVFYAQVISPFPLALIPHFGGGAAAVAAASVPEVAAASAAAASNPDPTSIDFKNNIAYSKCTFASAASTPESGAKGSSSATTPTSASGGEKNVLSCNGPFIAVKDIVIAPDAARSREASKQVTALQREIYVMQKLSHKNIVKYLGSRRNDDGLSIFMEYADGGTIGQEVRDRGKLPEAEAKRFTLQLLNGLEYLHQRRIVHRDLKGDNLFLMADRTLKVGDFGTSKEMQSIKTATDSIAGTPNFMAPEAIDGSGHGIEADIWSVGCCVIQMVTGRAPFKAYDNQMAIMFAIMKGKITQELPQDCSEELKDFLKVCTRSAAKERWSCPMLKEHAWIVGSAKGKTSANPSEARLKMMVKPKEATAPPK